MIKKRNRLPSSAFHKSTNKIWYEFLIIFDYFVPKTEKQTNCLWRLFWLNIFLISIIIRPNHELSTKRHCPKIVRYFLFSQKQNANIIQFNNPGGEKCPITTRNMFWMLNWGRISRGKTMFTKNDGQSNVISLQTYVNAVQSRCTKSISDAQMSRRQITASKYHLFAAKSAQFLETSGRVWVKALIVFILKVKRWNSHE